MNGVIKFFKSWLLVTAIIFTGNWVANKLIPTFGIKNYFIIVVGTFVMTLLMVAFKKSQS